MRYDHKPFYACKDTILAWLRSQDQPLAYYHGRRQVKTRRSKKAGIKHLVPIQQRHAPRTERGHWEADLMLFRFDSKHTITTLVERKSRYTILRLNHGKYAEPTMERIHNALKAIPQTWMPQTRNLGSMAARRNSSISGN